MTLLVVGLLLLAAPIPWPAREWSAPVAAAGAAEPPVAISFMIWGDPEEKKAYDELVAAFRRQHPEIDVNLVYTPNSSNFYVRLAMDLASGSVSDVCLLNYRRYAQFAAAGQLEPLDAYVAASTALKLADFFPPAVAPYNWRGHLYGIPQNISSLVVYYNRTLFRAAGLADPAPDWTWKDFVKTARALTKDTNGDGRTDQYGLGTEALLFRTAPFIWQNGGRLVDDPTAPRRLTLDEPATRQALQWFVELQSRHHVVPDAVMERAEPSASRFLNGRMGMFLDSRRGVPTYRKIDRFDWDVAPLPEGRQPASILHSDGFFMAARSRNKAAAWTFIEFASSVEGQTILAASGRTVPSRISVANSPVFLSPGERPANNRVFIDVVPVLQAVPVMPEWSTVEDLVGKELERAYHGSAPLDLSIERAIRNSRPYFRE